MWKTLAVALSVCILPACGGSSNSGSSFPAPTVNPTTEMFAGTVDVGSSDSHPFTVALSGGQLNVILTAAGPPATIFMGLAVGSWTAPTCTPLSGASTIVQAGTSAQLSGTANAGAFCVMVSDVGNQTAQISYTVTVTHY